MADRASLRIFLVLARALKVSDPFDAMGVFELLRRVSKAANLPMEGHMKAAIDASLTAISVREAHSTAVARYALERVLIEVEGVLGADAA